MLRSEFEFDARGEYSIEVDPRTVKSEHIALLAQLGLQPHQHRRAGFRSRRCSRPSTGYRAWSRRRRLSTRGARERLPFGERRSDLRFAQADPGRVRAHPRRSSTPEPGPHRALLLRASADAVQAAATYRRGRSAGPGDQAADPHARNRLADLSQATSISAWIISRSPGTISRWRSGRAGCTRNFQGYSGSRSGDLLGAGRLGDQHGRSESTRRTLKTLDEYYAAARQRRAARRARARARAPTIWCGAR